ncbi:MAG TPA: hypothetical protein PK544_05670 [Spirochaetota bacterium]|nr:hypothetical protein [Spirochaetota bacterium]HPJ38261.1 hypothetical protein [Spirochaetota bacterium]HPQ52303.1 hypothetical protein [Spirochaetota bacterium]
MYKELTGKMEMHISHDIDYRDVMKKRYATKDFGNEMQFSSVVELRNQ